MAISKVILNGETLMDVTSDTVEADKLLSGETATKNDGTKVTGNYAVRLQSKTANPSESQQVITPDADYDALSSVTVSAMKLQTTSVDPTESEQVVTASNGGTSISFSKSGAPTRIGTSNTGYYIEEIDTSWLDEEKTYHVTGTVSYHSYSSGTTSTYTVDSDYIYGGTFSLKKKADVYFELISTGLKITVPIGNNQGDRNISISGELTFVDVSSAYDGLKQVTVGAISSTYVGSAIPMRSAADIKESPVYSGVISAPYGYYSQSVSISLPSASLDLVYRFTSSTGNLLMAYENASTGRYLYSAYSDTHYQLPTLSAQTITPGLTSQYISSYQWLTGSQTIAAIPSADIISSRSIPLELSSKNYGFKSSTGIFTISSGINQNDKIISLPGYVSEGDRVTTHVTVSGTYELPILSAQTITPGSTVQYISSYQWLTGSQTIEAIPSTYVGSGVPSFNSTDLYVSGLSLTVYGPNYISSNYTTTLPFGLLPSVSGSESLYNTRLSLYAGSSSIYINIASGTHAAGTYVIRADSHPFYGFYKALRIDSTLYLGGLTSYSTNSWNNIQYEQSEIQEYFDTFSGRLRDGFFAGIFFSSNSGYDSITFNNITAVGSYAFMGFSEYGTNNRYITLNLPICTTICEMAFYKNQTFATINAPEASYIQSSAFGSAKVSYVNIPSCIEILPYTFDQCSKLQKVYAPKCQSIHYRGFYRCSSLSSIEENDFESLTHTDNYAFYQCANLSSVTFPNLKRIGSSAFGQCSKLTYFSAPNCRTVYDYALYSCSLLSNITMPLVETIYSYAFKNCTSLTSVNFSMLTSLSDQVFYGCTNLSYVSMPVCSYIGSSAFYSCNALVSLYLDQVSSVTSLYASTVFMYTPIERSTYTGSFGSIYVPASLYDAFISSRYWTYYSSRIVSV